MTSQVFLFLTLIQSNVLSNKSFKVNKPFCLLWKSMRCETFLSTFSNRIRETKICVISNFVRSLKKSFYQQLSRVYTGNFGRQLREATQPKIRKLLPKIAEVFTHKNCFVSTFHFYRFEYAEINDFKRFQTLLFYIQFLITVETT